MNKQFDIVVIGGGPGGYVAAICAAQLGFKVACIDDRKNKKGDGPALGGTCLNVGCIPSKALLQSSENFYELNNEFADHGINVSKSSIDVKKMIERKNKIVTKLTSGISFLLKKNKVDSFLARASIKGKKEELWEVEVKEKENTQLLEAKYIIIATGSTSKSLPFIEIDNKNILDNQGVLDLVKVPKKMGIIGAGVIGLEMGSVWKRLGSEVTIMESLDTFLPMADQQIAKEAYKVFTQSQGIDIQLGTKVLSVKNSATSVTVEYEFNGKNQKKIFDKLIVAVGRAPNTQGLNATEIGLKLDQRGFIEVDEECRTNLPNIWAIGDVVRGPMLAHKASEEGVAVAERIAGQKPEVNLDIIPSVVYTSPEIAWVGKTEEELKQQGIDYKKGNSLFSANGRALSLGHAAGIVKVLADKKTDRILGVHMIGPMVSELIAEAVLGLEFVASSEDIARTVHAHPTLSEVFHEAALAVDKRAIHG